MVLRNVGRFVLAAAAICIWSADLLAQKVPSGVPAQTTTNNPTQTGPRAPSNAPAAQTGVNINTASSEDLLKLPGMTSQRVTAIMRGRPYASVDELNTRKILKPATLDRLRPYIVVSQ